MPILQVRLKYFFSIKEFRMRIRSHVLPVIVVLALALGLILPAAAQDTELMSYAAESCEYGGIIQSITALDPLTVEFQLCEPDPAFPSKVAFSSVGIQPSEHLEATGGGGEALFRNPIGTGPYQLVNWELGNEIVMTRFEDYWGEPAREGTLIFRWSSEAAQRLVELQAGTVDGIDNPGAGDFDVIRNDPNLQLFEREGLNIFYVGLNNTVEPFTDIRVRQAISHAINKERIVDNFYPPGSSVADQFLPSGIPGFTEGFEATPYDPDTARALIEEAAAENGWTLPLEVTLNYRDVVRGYLPQPGIVAQDIQAQLADVGINVTIEVMESGAFLDAADRGELSFFMLGWGADYPDATNFLDVHFGQGSSPQFGEKSPEIVALLNQAASLSDQAARAELYAQANELIRDFVPMVPIAHGGSGAAYKANITGAHVSPLGNENFAIMEDPDDDVFVWMQNGEPAGLYCADETDGEALRVCEQITEPLLGYEIGGTAVVPALATEYTANEDLTTWTFNLREGVTFHDGSTFDANDVVMTYAVQWDAAHPLHVGRDGGFSYWTYLFRAFLNAPE
jgi:peptide/nickel transport system substrate-binding protein